MSDVAMFSIQYWALTCIGLAAVLALAALVLVASRPKVALLLFGSACLSAVVAGVVLTHLGSQEAGPEAYAGLRKAVARDPAMRPMAREALADGRLSNQEAVAMAEVYNERLGRRRAAEAQALKRRTVDEITAPDGRP